MGRHYTSTQEQKTELPGPSDYHSDYLINKSRIQVGFTSQERPELFIIDTDIPAPSKYNPKEMDMKLKISFLKTKR